MFKKFYVLHYLKLIQFTMNNSSDSEILRKNIFILQLFNEVLSIHVLNAEQWLFK